MNKLKVISFSGGAFQFAELFGAAYALAMIKKERFNVFAGTSSGAIVAALAGVACNDLTMWEEIKLRATTYKLKDVFSIPPVNKKGHVTLRAIIRAIRSFFGARVTSLGKQRIPDLLRPIITEKRWKDYKNSQFTPIVYVCVSEASTGKTTLKNLKEVPTYEEYLQWIAASAAIPVMTEAVEINGKHYFDGGLKYHNPSPLLVRELSIKISKLVSVYSRSTEETKQADSRWDDNIVATTLHTVDVMGRAISVHNEQLADEKANKLGIEQIKIHLPLGLSGWYTASQEDLDKLFKGGVKETLRLYK
jgi:predicted acylesterase/phospholipase RssA